MKKSKVRERIVREKENAIEAVDQAKLSWWQRKRKVYHPPTDLKTVSFMPNQSESHSA